MNEEKYMEILGRRFKYCIQDNKLISLELLKSQFPKSNPCLQQTKLEKKLKQELTEYFEQKRKTFTIPIKLIGTPFQKRVWQELLNIPYGTTVSYQEIATRIGNPKASRAVGQANNKNPIIIIVPCHRVIGKNGKLIGYAEGLDIKEELLTLEQLNS